MPHRRGEPGHREYNIGLIEQGRCACEGCPGTLTDPVKSPTGWGFCRSCGCAHKVGIISGVGYAETIPAYGRCRVADALLAERARQRDRDARKRLLAEEEAGETWETGR